MLSTSNNQYHASIFAGSLHGNTASVKAPVAHVGFILLYQTPGHAWAQWQSTVKMQVATHLFLQNFALRLLTSAYLYNGLLQPQDRPQFRHETPRTAPPAAAPQLPHAALPHPEPQPAPEPAPEPSTDGPAAAHSAPKYQKAEALAILGLKPGVAYTREEVKSAFNQQVKAHHPDMLKRTHPDIGKAELEWHQHQSARATDAWLSLQDAYPQPK